MLKSEARYKFMVLDNFNMDRCQNRFFIEISKNLISSIIKFCMHESQLRLWPPINFNILTLRRPKLLGPTCPFLKIWRKRRRWGQLTSKTWKTFFAVLRMVSVRNAQIFYVSYLKLIFFDLIFIVFLNSC